MPMWTNKAYVFKLYVMYMLMWPEVGYKYQLMFMFVKVNILFRFYMYTYLRSPCHDIEAIGQCMLIYMNRYI